MTDEKATFDASKTNDIDKKLNRFASAIFFTATATIGFLSAFGISFIQSKKSDSKKILKKLENQPDLHDQGVNLAKRALLRASTYSVGGVALLSFTIWKLTGASSFEEFRYTIGSWLPRITKDRKENEPPQDRTEFKNLTELFQYFIDEDKKEKEEKSRAKNDKQ